MARTLQVRSVSLTCKQLLTDSIWFGQISEAARQQVQRSMIEKKLLTNQPLGIHGEWQHHWFGVMEGLLKWSTNAMDGRTVTLGGQSVGSWFGEGTLLRQRPRAFDIVALRPSTVAMLPFDTFDWLRRNEPAFAEFLLLQINERLHWFMGNMAACRLLDSERLVKRALWGLIHPLLNPRGLKNLIISQEELANLATVSRQRCNAALIKLQREKVIDLEYGAITILNGNALQDSCAY
jgi:CRP-like cAMP-binding protein